MVEIKDYSSQLNKDRLDLLEKRINIILPEEYRAFLLKFNGGYPVPDGFSFVNHKGKDDASIVDRFLGIDVGEYSNLEKYLNLYKNRLPLNFLPIAHDPGGNLIVIGTKNEELNRIYFWDHEFEADGISPDKSNMYLIANSFNGFLEGLYEINID